MLYAILWAAFSLIFLHRLFPALNATAFTLNSYSVSWTLLVALVGSGFFLIRGSSK